MRTETMRLFDAFEKLIGEERDLLRACRLEAVGAMAASKTALLDRLTTGLDAECGPRLDRLRALAAENQALLGAALNGVKAARARLGMIRNVAGRLDLYDAKGRATSVSFLPGSVEKRA